MAGLVEFLVLGTIDVVVDGTSVVPTSARQRDLLALLLLEANVAVSSDRLMHRLWLGEPPPTARSALQTYIAKLRVILDGCPGAVITTVSGGYRLDVDEATIDAHRFEDLVGRGREALLAGSAATAVEHLRSALDLWRGDAYGDVRHLEGIHAEVTRLEELHANAVGTLIDAELALGNHLEVIPRLERLVEEEPLRERHWAQLMLALYRAGRQSDALRAYRRVRDVLGEELGIEPGPDLYDLEERILLHDPTLDLVPSGDRPPTNLERAVTSFVGRRDELDRLVELVGTRPLTTLTGPGGAGKTRLAREIGERLLDRYPDGVWLVDLSPIRDGGQIPYTIAEVLGVTEQPDRPMLEVVRRHLGPRSLLLILDNCEHVLEDAAVATRSLLGACPSLTILATSRERLGVEGETTWTVPPLTFPARGVRDEDVARHEAVELFVERARLVDPDFTLDVHTADSVAEICRRLDGLPLAIELAAARVDVLSVADIEQRLDADLSLLEKRSRFQPLRHATLRAAVQWSYDQLDDDERLLFERLSVFTGRFRLDDVVAVCADERFPAADVFDVLTRLVDKSLVVAHTAHGPDTRYSMLDTLRTFAAEALDASGDRADMALRHARRYAAVAHEADPMLRGAEQGEWLERLDADHDNLRLAFDRLLDAGMVEEALAMGTALQWFWKMHDNVTEGTARLDAALAAGGDVSPLVRSRALTAAAVLESAHDVEGAYARLEESLALAVDAGDDLGRGLALGWMGLLDRVRGRLEDSHEHLTAALALLEGTGEGWAVAFALGHLGVLARERGDLGAAAGYHERAMAIAEETGNPQEVAWNVAGLGIIRLYEGAYDEAISLLEDSYRVEKDIGFDFESATVLIVMALAEARIGKPEQASRHLAQAHRRARRLGSARLADAVYRARATLAHGRGETVRAAQLLGAADRFREDNGLSRSMFQAFFDDDEADIRSALGDDAYGAAWEAGRGAEISDTLAS